MRLFKKEDVKRFYGILHSLDRGYADDSVYKGYDINNPHITKCQMEVFIDRTLNKWLKGKCFVLYIESGIGIEYKQYVRVTRVSLKLDYSAGTISVGLYDYSKPYDIFNSINLSVNEAMRLEGEWCINEDQHNLIADLFALNLPDKEFIFNAYDLSISDNVGDCKTTHTIIAKTEKEAYNIKHSNKNKDLIITELII